MNPCIIHEIIILSFSLYIFLDYPTLSYIVLPPRIWRVLAPSMWSSEWVLRSDAGTSKGFMDEPLVEASDASGHS